MDKDFIENNNLKKILKNYLKQENLTIDTLSKESKIKIETIKKILENNYNRPHKSTLVVVSAFNFDENTINNKKNINKFFSFFIIHPPSILD